MFKVLFNMVKQESNQDWFFSTNFDTASTK